MSGETLAFVGAVFVLAGLVKGVIGLGLPTIAMGLLALVLTPLEAAAVLVLPSFVTNVWQVVAGPSLSATVVRFWPMMLGVAAGTWAGSGLMSGASSRLGAGLLGVALVVYAASGLAAWRMKVARTSEPVLGPLVGAATGVVTAATGVFVIPAVPYLQAVGLEKDDLVQALGFFFLVSTVALGAVVAANGGLNVTVAAPAFVALAAALGGMGIGQAIRGRIAPDAFRRCFFLGLLALGLFLLVRALP
jgi:hypothetical protein